MPRQNAVSWSDDATWHDPAEHTSITTIELQTTMSPTSKYASTGITIIRRGLDGKGLDMCYISIPTTELTKLLAAQGIPRVVSK